MHRSHLVPCAAMLIAAVVVALVWGVQVGTLALVGVMLLCPLAMLLVLRVMATSHPGHDGGHVEPRIDQPGDAAR